MSLTPPFKNSNPKFLLFFILNVCPRTWILEFPSGYIYQLIKEYFLNQIKSKVTNFGRIVIHIFHS